MGVLDMPRSDVKETTLEIKKGEDHIDLELS
jgi:hypothetical protein